MYAKIEISNMSRFQEIFKLEYLDREDSKQKIYIKRFSLKWFVEHPFKISLHHSETPCKRFNFAHLDVVQSILRKGFLYC